MREVQRQRHDLLSSLMIGYRRGSEPGRWVLKTCIPVRLITLELANCCSCNVEVCAQNLDPVQSRSVRVMRTRLECMQRLCVVTTMERSSAAVSAVKMERRDWCEAINDDAAADDGVGSASSHVRPSQTADRAVSLPPSHISPATRTRRWAGYFATRKGAEYCDKHACVSLRLSARISHERHVQKTLRVHDFCSCGSILLWRQRNLYFIAEL